MLNFMLSEVCKHVKVRDSDVRISAEMQPRRNRVTKIIPIRVCAQIDANVQLCLFVLIISHVSLIVAI